MYIYDIYIYMHGYMNCICCCVNHATQSEAYMLPLSPQMLVAGKSHPFCTINRFFSKPS